MNKRSTLFALFCLLATTAVVFSACSAPAVPQPTAVGSDLTQSTPTEPPITIDFAFLTFNQVPEDTTPVENAINAITVPKINAKVKLHPYSLANYSQQINLALQ